jgi:uncharacterized OB-fold protein
MPRGMTDSYSGPIPKPTPESLPFWQGTLRGELLLQRCQDCSTVFFYPRAACPDCLSAALRWEAASGRGTLYSFVINHRAPRKFPVAPPYVVGLVALDEGPRLMARIVEVEADPRALRCDMPVEVVFEWISEGIALPHFRPRRTP